VPARVELHTHLEGAVTPRRLLRLAERYGQPGVPDACLVPDGTAYAVGDFAQFLTVYKHLTSVLRTPADFHAVALDLGEQLAADGVVYAEVTVSFGVLLHREIDPLPVQEALAEAADEIASTHRVTVRWLPDAVRQWGLDPARRAWEAAATCGRRLGVVGFGLGGDETAGPAASFAPLFAEVAAEGFGVTIHAGEAAGPASVRAAVEACGAARIGHGTTAAADDAVLALLAERGIHVEICPGSNVRTGAVQQLSDHPLPRFLATGVSCALNTDDRALFSLDLAGEYARAQEVLGLAPQRAAVMQREALAAAFCDEATRAAADARLKFCF
jgi:adenosine deaminase